MKPDLYTKAVLTVIALMLILIACNQYVSPAVTASAQAPFAGAQFSASDSGFRIFDTRTGEIWYYDTYNFQQGKLTRKLRLTKLGQPPVLEFDSTKK